MSEHSNLDSEKSDSEVAITDSTHDSETDNDDNSPLMFRIHVCTSKNSCKWYNNMPPQNVCYGAQNIETQVPGVKEPPKNAPTALDIWCCLISDEMISEIIVNIQIFTYKKKRERDVYAYV